MSAVTAGQQRTTANEGNTMSDWGDDSLEEWSKTASSHKGERLNAMESQALTAAEGTTQVDREGSAPEAASAPASPQEKGADEPTQLDYRDVDDEIRPVPVFAVLTDPESSETAPKRGRWEVVTEASRYQLDLDRELLRRVRGTVKPGPGVAFPSKLRDHDRGWVRLLRIVHLELGMPAVFDIESLGGPEVAFTRRSTTYVMSIRQLGDDETFE